MVRGEEALEVVSRAGMLANESRQAMEACAKTTDLRKNNLRIIHGIMEGHTFALDKS